MTKRPACMLVVGPSGSGKTPLGDALERTGFRGRRCLHLDFGARLRGVAGGAAQVDMLSEEDRRTVRRVLDSGALLENHEFHIAGQILRSFAAERELTAEDVLVLNGIPRHVDQARAVDGLVDVRLVVCLVCSDQVAWERIRRNSGGDRAGREDDERERVIRRLARFRERTRPILEHYRDLCVPIAALTVETDTQPAAVIDRLPAV